MLKSFLINFGVVCLCLFVFSLVMSIVYNKKQGLRIGKSAPKIKESFLVRILFMLPFQFVCDLYNREDYSFDKCGFHLIVGEQGSGKTITMVYLLKKYKKEYPNLKVRTNMCYKDEDGAIKSWRDLVFQNNGVSGEIDVLDEVQNWFSSLQSRDFPPEMLQEITQQRKQRKMILGTSQVWNRVAKPIREQVSLVYKPITLFGCLTICPYFKPIVNDDGQCDAFKYRGIFFFVHTPEIRDAFDTYHKIQMMSLKGFKPDAEQLGRGASVASYK